MKNFIKHLFMLCLFGMISIGAKAEEIPNNQIWYEASEQLAETTSTYSSGLHMDAFNTTIKTHTFSNGKGVITFDTDVTSIGVRAFYYCEKLTSVTIPNSVTSIGGSAFSYCEKLTSVTIPNSVTSIGGSAFYQCSGLKSVTIPESVTSIGYEAFSYCDKLTKVNITNLDKWAEIEFGNDYANPLYYAHNLYLNEQLVTEAKLTTAKKIDDYAFYNCKGLTSVTIPNSVTSIGGYAFYYCNSLTSVTIPNSVTSIGYKAFYQCRGLKSIEIPNSVTSIGGSAFYQCTGLTNVTIPNSVTEIGGSAFYQCTGLTNVTIGNSVTSIGGSAFSYCEKLTSVNITDLDKWVEINFVSANANPLYIAHNLYLNGQFVTNAELTTAKKICSYAFGGCTGLTSVTIPESVTSIGGSAFSGCSGLTSVTIPESVTLIGGAAFYDCSSLTSVTIPNSVTEIGNMAFDNCSKLASVTIPNSVTSIGDWAFSGCSAMRSVYVGWDKESDIPSVNSNTFPYSKCTLYVPQGAADLYLAKEYWKNFKSIYGGLIIEDKDGNKTSVPIADSNPSFELSDDINSINNSGIIRDVTITYTRNFEKAGVWQAWYMPFDVAFDDMKDAYDVAQIHGVLLDKDNNAVIAFLKLDQGTVKANTPYVVRPKKSGEVVIKPKTNLQIHPTSFYMMSATHKYTIGGVFEKTTTSGNWYALNLNGQFQLMDNGVYLRPFRIHMTIDPRIDNPYAQSASTTAKIDIVVLGDDETTGIKESLTPALSEGKGAIYNLSGQRVNSIQKGQIYIMNGKKFIAK